MLSSSRLVLCLETRRVLGYSERVAERSQVEWFPLRCQRQLVFGQRGKFECQRSPNSTQMHLHGLQKQRLSLFFQVAQRPCTVHTHLQTIISGAAVNGSSSPNWPGAVSSAARQPDPM